MPITTWAADGKPTNRAARRALARRRGGAVLAAGAAAFGTGAAVLAVTATPAGAITIPVTNTNDAGAGSLRDALAAAGDGDVIDATGISGTITLATGELVIADEVTISGPGSGALTIDAGNTSRIFSSNNVLGAGETLTISGFTLTQGNGVGAAASGAGGAVFVSGPNAVACNLVVDDVAFLANSSTNLGGGLYFDQCDGGSVTISDSAFTQNTGPSAAMWVEEMATTTITATTVTGNTAAAGDCCAILYLGSTDATTITDSNISDNDNLYTGGNGVIRAFYPDSSLTIANSTLSGNLTSDNGGGGLLYGEWSDVDLLQSTIVDNVTPGSGAVMYLFDDAEISVVGTIIANNTDASGSGAAAVEFATGGLLTDLERRSSTNAQGEPRAVPDVGAQATVGLTLDSSLVEGLIDPDITVTEAGTNIRGVAPVIGALASNGGPTQTRALLPGSPAIDAGPETVPSFPSNAFDQRGPGYARVVDGRVDIGAFEVQALVIVPRFTG